MAKLRIVRGVNYHEIIRTHTHRLSRNESVNCKLKVDLFSCANKCPTFIYTEKRVFHFDSVWFQFARQSFFYSLFVYDNNKFAGNQKIIIIFKIVYACLKSVFVLDFWQIYREANQVDFLGLFIHLRIHSQHTHMHPFTHSHGHNTQHSALQF